ncbi:uncharacterized protein TNCV_2570361 [Trichonephila clavipes]|nr:uncharacterized protein TNCV_2570361 [Trichonephila clavipes]
MFPGLGKRTPNRKVDKLTNRRRGQSSNFFTVMTRVTWCVPALPFPPLALSFPWRRFGGTTSVRFSTVTQNWAIFSFTLEPKKVSVQKTASSTASPLRTNNSLG